MSNNKPSKSTNGFSKEVKDYIKRVFDNKVNTKLTDADLETLKNKMKQSIEIDIQKLITSEKFVSGLLLRIPVIPVRDCRVNTALTDGTNIYFDIDFYTRLDENERVFVLAHEVWHNALLHFLRRENRESDTWNIATDCEINYALSEDGFVMPPGLCFPVNEDRGKCAEDIYDRIIHQKNKNHKKNKNNSESDNGQDKKSDNNRGWTTTGINEKNQKGKRKFNNQFDNHADKNTQGSEYGENVPDPENGNENGFKSPSDKWGEKGFDKDFKPCITDDVADKIREMVISEAQRYERTKGNVPNSIKRIIESICKPEIKWEELLAQFVTNCLGDRRQWLPPLRRGVYNEMYFQSRRGEKINVACIVDTSGSTTADIPKFLSELVSLLNTFGRYELTLIHCDCVVHRVDTFDDNNPFPVDNPLEYSFEGGGGSSLIPAYEELIQMGIDPSCVIILTDGYIDVPESNPLDIPSLFVLTSDGVEPAKWGTHIRFKEKLNNGFR